MRYLEYGKFVSQHPDFDFQEIAGRSVLTWISTSNQEFTSGEHNGIIEHAIGEDPNETNSVFNRLLVRVDLDTVRTLLGQIPVVIRAEFSAYRRAPTTGGSWKVQIYKMLTTYDPGDTTNRYRDKTELDTWYEDAYGPMWGQDVVSSPEFEEGTVTTSAGSPLS